MTVGCGWSHAPEASAEDFGDLKKNSVSGVLTSEEEDWLSEFAEALRWVPQVVVGQMEKSV